MIIPSSLKHFCNHQNLTLDYAIQHTHTHMSCYLEGIAYELKTKSKRILRKFPRCKLIY